MQEKTKGTALITGGTSGIGKAFATAFAKKGYDLVITGRRREKIESVADSIKKEHKVKVEVIICELSDKKELDKLIERVRSTDNLEILVNNAGFAVSGSFHESDIGPQREMLAVHSVATMELTYAALPKMVKNGRGYIINLSSIGGLLPFPGNSIYSATKAFVKFFTESIHLELKGTGVRVQALCPGMTVTDFHEKMGLKPSEIYETKGMSKAMSPDEVVKISLDCLKRDRPICIPGLNNRITHLMVRFMPERLMYKIIVSSLRK
ncbi:MAG: SDR family oxidoreductase [Deltaproteobacteria bacterium]|uniref:NADP-dependent 3-hydroxy acid dehydrogenase YdfG n=1 Tax=Candidatus Zymogenus saltonus TaxID=2844893 RepID=A0A9D8KJR4_9DELT|nr:SDR family oxidoreductase [Candidatus Zymogenus saltonus]